MAGSTGRSYKANFHAILVEHGRSFTDSVDKCAGLIMAAAENNPAAIDSRFAADLIISIMSHNRPEFSSDTYDDSFWLPVNDDVLAAQIHPTVLMRALLQINQDITMERVIARFKETSSFLVRDKAGVHFVSKCIALLTPNNFFPVDQILRAWLHDQNQIGQLSWIGQLLLNPDIVCFGDLTRRPLNISCLKIPPDENNREIRNWLSLELLDTFLDLADRHEKLVIDIIAKKHDHLIGGEVRPLIPATQCPDLLILGCIQLVKPLNDFRKALLRQLVVQLMINQTNAVPVLNVLWNTETFGGLSLIQRLVVEGLALFYKVGSEENAHLRLTKILEVAHELKPNGLGELFNVTQFDFTIDLACLAARRDFLKLDKFLDDKLTEHSEVFAQHLVQYIKQRYPPMPGQVVSLSKETFQTMYNALQLRASYSPAIDNELHRLTMHIRQTTKSVEPRPPMSMYGNQAPTPNPFLYGRSGNASPGHLISNGSMTTPVFGNSQRPLGASTPTYPYTNNMDIRNPISDIYRGNMNPAPPTGWGNSTTTGWSSRSTPVPVNPPMDFRPSFAQPSSSAQGHNLVGGGMNLSSGMDNQGLDQVFTEEIQDEANSYFQRMFTDNSQLPVSEFIKKMAEFRNSPNPRERDILNCVIKNLFDEFKFFNEYPEYELKTTAEVYGGFINEGIVQNLQFATAVRRVIEAIHNPPEMPLFTFGIVALEACKGVLHRYPKICIIIKSNESFARFPEHLKEYIKAGCESRLPSMDNMTQQAIAQAQIAEAAQGAMARADSVRGTSMMMVSNMDILEKGTEEDGKTVVLKEESLVEEVSFMCNNLSLANLASKVEELRKILNKNDDIFRQWLAQYLVMKRITLEQNFHSLYNAFLLSVDDTKLNQFVKQETLRNIKILLKSDKRQAASNFGDRQLLKNLGHWLGLITLARNQPIFLEDLNLRDLLLEAFYKGQQELLFVIPFVVKVIISASKSIVFQPSCAWVNQILQILAEIHRQSDLKLNLKFEIEVLCKELHVTLDSLVGDSSFLQDTERITHLNPQLSEVAILTRPELQGNEMGGGPYDPTGRASALQAGMYPQQPQNVDSDIVQNSMASYYQQGNNQPTPPAAHFNYIDINIYDNIEGLIVIPPHLTLNQMIPNLSQHLRHAIATAVREIIAGIVERSVTVALSMTSDIILKDFNSISNEQQMRRAYLQMMRSTTAAIGMITTREPLATNIIQYTRQIMSQNTQNFASIPEMQRFVEEVLQNVIEHNLEMASCYIVKTACEKATAEIEKKMEDHIMRRKNAMDLESFDVPPDVQAVIDRMPAELLPRNRNLTDAELQVYDYFTSQMCGFKPATIEDLYVDFIRLRGESAVMSVNDLEGLSKNLDTCVQNMIDVFISRYVPPHTEFHTCCTNIRQSVIEFLRHLSQENLISLVDRLTEGFLVSYVITPDSRHQVASNMERNMNAFCEIFTSLVSRIMSHVEHMDVIRVITRVAVSGVRDRLYLNPDAYDVLIRHRMVNLAIFDQLFSRYIENVDPIMVNFIQKLLSLLSSNDKRRPLVSYLPLTIQQMKTIANRNQAKTETTPYGSNTNGGSVYEIRNTLSGVQLTSYSVGRQDAGAVDDLFSYRELPTNDFQCKVEGILREWMNICHTNEGAARSSHVHNNVITSIKNQGIPLTLESITKFFKTCLDICLDVCYRLLKDDNPSVHQRCNHTLDAFCRLMCVLVKHGDSICGSSGNVDGRITLLHKVLDSFNTSLIHDHDVRRDDFSGFPFYRIFHTMLTELCIGPNALRDMKWAVLEAFGHAMFYIQPRRAPAFSYHWLDIVGHRQFISQLLAEPNAPALTRAIYTQLLVSLLKFLAPSLRNVTMSGAVQALYKGTLRVMLIVLHDFPELLCEYYYILCDVIPPNCIQLRNLVLSAYPRNMRLPDPFGQSFDQIQLLSEMKTLPKIPFEMFSLIPEDMRAQLDTYLNTRNGVTFLSELANKLETGHQPGLKYNIPVLNAIVSYVGVRAIHQLKDSDQGISISTISHSAYMDVYQSLAISFCSEGRYILFNALANQLRYPNAQTHYFACALLYLFSESKDDRIKEQITRIMFERLVSMRPHPWGLLITFIELIRNEQYHFWQYDFVHCAPEIERLFASVASSCSVNLPTKYGSADGNTGSVPA